MEVVDENEKVLTQVSEPPFFPSSLIRCFKGDMREDCWVDFFFLIKP